MGRWDKTQQKKVPVKKPINRHLKKACELCLYSETIVGDPDMIRCHRYPQATKAQATHWCGEYILKDKS
jgi:hypothetical protein